MASLLIRKKSNFALKEGKLIGHIVSADGFKIDPKRVEAIKNLSLPRSRKTFSLSLGLLILSEDL